MKRSRKVANLLAELADRGVADDLIAATLARAEEYGLTTGRPKGRRLKLDPLHLDVVAAVDHLRQEHLSIPNAARVLAMGGALGTLRHDEIQALYDTGRKRPLVAEVIEAARAGGSPRLRVGADGATRLGFGLESTADSWPALAEHLGISDEVIDHLYRDDVIEPWKGAGGAPRGVQMVVWHRADYDGPRYVALAIAAVKLLPPLRWYDARGTRHTLIFGTSGEMAMLDPVSPMTKPVP